jgi:hypothetical protein
MSRRYPADRNGGTCGNVIDLSYGPDEAPEPKQIELPPWPGMIAHTRHGDGRIWLDASTVYNSSTPVDMRCGSCTAGTEIVLDHLTELLVFMIHHQPGCQAVSDMLALAGVA